MTLDREIELIFVPFRIAAVHEANLSELSRRLLTEIKNPILRGTARDLLVNQKFRRDIL
jgi:hypothetical protein